MTKGKGDFVWFELQTTSREKSVPFFSELFGWTAEDQGGYIGWKNGEAQFGGVEEQRQPGALSAWLGYIETEDVDGVAERTKKMGGQVLAPPMDLPGSSGRIAVLMDPQGAAFAVYKGGAGHEGWEPSKERTGDVGWAELGTTDVEGWL